MATPVVLTTGARPITPVESGGVPMTPVDTLGEPVTVVDTLGEPVVLINNDGTPAFLAYSAKTYLGGVAPYHWLDFINNRALYAGADVGNVTQATGYSFTRASDGYYTNADGTLTLFGSGALRRGDRGVLIEGSRTNLLVRSQEFDNGAWSTNGATVTANTIAAPDGTTTADQITTTTTNGYIYPTNSALFLAAGGATFVYSVFAKAGTATTITLLLGATANYIGTFNLSTGVASTSSANTTVSMTDAGSGWYRCVLTCAAVASIAYAEAQIGRVASGLTFSIWGAQLEAASFASSYIPTVAAAATRAADVLSYTAGVSYPLSLWAEFEPTGLGTGYANIIQLDANGGADRTDIGHIGDDGYQAVTNASIEVAGFNQSATGNVDTLAVGVSRKFALRAATNNTRPANGGTLVGSNDTVCAMPTSPTILRIGTDQSNRNVFGFIRRVAVVSGAVSDAQLQSMTGS